MKLKLLQLFLVTATLAPTIGCSSFATPDAEAGGAAVTTGPRAGDPTGASSAAPVADGGSVATADPALASQSEMLYKFPIRLVPTTHYDPQGANAYPVNDYDYSVSDTGITVESVYAGCCHTILNFEFKTGTIVDHEGHSGSDRNTQSPAAGGDAAAYKTALTSFQQLLVDANAPHDAVTYIGSILTLCNAQQADLAAHLAADQAKIMFEPTTDLGHPSALIAYNASDERDIVVDFADARSNVTLGTGRVHVARGAGTVRVPVTFPQPVTSGSFGGMWTYANVVPTGADESKSISKDKLIRG